MLFDIALYISLIIFGIGMVYKISTWFVGNIGAIGQEISTGERLSSAIKGILGTLFSGRIIALIKVIFWDVLLQRRILKDEEDRSVWIMHIFIFAGFIFLLIFH